MMLPRQRPPTMTVSHSWRSASSAASALRYQSRHVVLTISLRVPPCPASVGQWTVYPRGRGPSQRSAFPPRAAEAVDQENSVLPPGMRNVVLSGVSRPSGAVVSVEILADICVVSLMNMRRALGSGGRRLFRLQQVHGCPAAIPLAEFPREHRPASGAALGGGISASRQRLASARSCVMGNAGGR